MHLYKSAALSVAVAVPAFLLGMSWAHQQTAEEAGAAREIVGTVLREMRETRASLVLALADSLEATRAGTHEDPLTPLERELQTQVRLLEGRSGGTSHESTRVARALEKGRAYAAAHPQPHESHSQPASSPFSQATTLPEYEEGSLVGLRISGLLPGSFLASLGVHDGDLLATVQGTPITSGSQAAEALRTIERQPPGLQIEVVRAGERLKLGAR